MENKMLTFGKSLDNRADELMDLGRRAVRTLENVPEVKESSGATPSRDYVPMTVETFDNHVYFYAKVDTDRCLDLMKRIRNIDNELRTQRSSRMLPKDYPAIPIWLHIQSNGGELFTGFNVADQIQTIESPIFSIVEGVCASAATMISVACNKRYILRSSYMMIHEFSSQFWGKYREFKDDMKLQDMAMDRLASFYVEHTTLTKDKALELLDHDSWFDSQECLNLHFVDEILDGRVLE
jgi:ATP-dependent protease ClpP protease subunit